MVLDVARGVRQDRARPDRGAVAQAFWTAPITGTPGCEGEHVVTTSSTPDRPRAARRIALPALAGAVLTSALGLTASAASTVARKAKPPPFSTLEKSLQAEEHLTFKVTYTAHSAGKTTTLVFEQRPPDARFGEAQGFVLELAGKTYFCASALGHAMCFKSSSTTNPLLGLVGLFSPAAIVTELKTLEAETLTKLAGVTVTSSSKTIAGQASTCVNVSAKKASYEYCVTNSKGILAYGGSSRSYVVLSSYSSTAPASDFALPAGASITTG